MIKKNSKVEPNFIVANSIGAPTIGTATPPVRVSRLLQTARGGSLSISEDALARGDDWLNNKGGGGVGAAASSSSSSSSAALSAASSSSISSSLLSSLPLSALPYVAATPKSGGPTAPDSIAPNHVQPGPSAPLQSRQEKSRIYMSERLQQLRSEFVCNSPPTTFSNISLARSSLLRICDVASQSPECVGPYHESRARALGEVSSSRTNKLQAICRTSTSGSNCRTGCCRENNC